MNVKVNLSTPPHLIWETMNSEGDKVVRWYEKHANKLGGLEQLSNKANRNMIDDPKHASQVVFQQNWKSPPYDTPEGKKEYNLYNCIDIVHYANRACFQSQGLLYLYYKTEGSAGMYLIWELDEDERDAGGTTMPRKFVMCFTSHFFLRYCDTERKMGTINPDAPEQILVDFFLRNRFGISTQFMRQYRDTDGTEKVDICLAGCVGRGKVRRDDSDIVMYEFDTCLAWKMLYPKQYHEMNIVMESYTRFLRRKLSDAEDMKANVTGNRGYLLEDLEREALRDIVMNQKHAVKVMRVVTRLREYVQYMLQFTDPAVNKGRDVYDYLRNDVPAYVTEAYHVTSKAICKNMNPSEFEDLFLTALQRLIDHYNVPISKETVEEKYYEKEGQKNTCVDANEAFRAKVKKVLCKDSAKVAKAYPNISIREHRGLFIDVFSYLTCDKHQVEKILLGNMPEEVTDELYARHKNMPLEEYNKAVTLACREIIYRNNITDIDFGLLYELESTRWSAMNKDSKNNTNNNRTNNNDVMNEKLITEFKTLVKKQIKKFSNYTEAATGLAYEAYLRQAEPLFVLSRIIPTITGKDAEKAKEANKAWIETLVDNRTVSALEPYIRDLGKELVTLAIHYMIDNDCWQSPRSKEGLQSKSWDYTSLEDIRQAAACICENEGIQPNPEPPTASTSSYLGQDNSSDTEPLPFPLPSNAPASNTPSDLGQSPSGGMIDFTDIAPSDDLHVSISQAKQDLKTATIAISRLTECAARLKNFVSNADPDIDKSQKAVAELLTENERLKKQLETKKREADTIKSERDDKQRIINDLRNQLNTVTQDKANLDREKQEWLKTRKDQADALKVANDTIAQLKKQQTDPDPVEIKYAELHREQPFLSTPAIRNFNAYLMKHCIGKITGID